MLQNGYIKLFRSLISWEWYQDINVKTLFIHLLLTVNYEPNKWQGVLIDKGQRITSVDNLAKETKLSTMQIRGCLAKLRQTGEISIKTTNKYTLITVENYTKFQGEEIEDNKRITNEQQTDNKRITTKEESNKKAKESIKNIYSVFDSYSDNEDLRQTLRDYSIMRNKIKAPLTERAVSMLLNKLDTLASADDLKIKLLEQAILSNWKSVYPLNEDKQQQTKTKPNKFHNFIQSGDVVDLEAVAEQRRNKLQEKLKG